MKKLSFYIFLLIPLLCAPFAHAQTHTQSLSFDDLGLGGGTTTSGTYLTTDTFSFDVYLTYNGYNSGGYSLVLEAPVVNNFAGSLSIIGVTYGSVFSDPIQLGPNPAPFDYSFGNSPGYLAEHRDLGATDPGSGSTFMFHPPGTYFIGHISFAISGATPGIYTIRSTTITSEVSDENFNDNPLPAEDYTITIIPEPGTVGLIGLGLGSLAFALHRKKRVA